MKVSTIVLALAGTSQALSLVHNDVHNAELNVDVPAQVQHLDSRGKGAGSFFGAVFSALGAFGKGKFRGDAVGNTISPPNKDDFPIVPSGTGFLPTGTGAPFPTGTSSVQEPAAANIRRRAKHFYPANLAIDYKLAPKAPAKVKRVEQSSGSTMQVNVSRTYMPTGGVPAPTGGVPTLTGGVPAPTGAPYPYPYPYPHHHHRPTGFQTMPTGAPYPYPYPHHHRPTGFQTMGRPLPPV